VAVETMMNRVVTVRLRVVSWLLAIVPALVPIGFSPSIAVQSDNEGEAEISHVVKVGASTTTGAARRLTPFPSTFGVSTPAHPRIALPRNAPLPQFPDPVAHIIRC